MRSDKGRKRGKYDTSKSKAAREAKQMRETHFGEMRVLLDAEAKAVADERPKRKRSCGKHETPRKLRRRLEREAMLPKDRKCANCGKIKLKSAQWVVKPMSSLVHIEREANQFASCEREIGHYVICKSCETTYQKMLKQIVVSTPSK